MNRYALISDIHANLPALEAVFARIEELGITEIGCLGDVVGYGPDPEACIDLVMERCRFTLKGNHDWGLEGRLHEFNTLAREVLEWTRKRLKPGLLQSPKKQRWRFLMELPERHEEWGALFVHGSPRDPIKEYVMRSDGFLNPEKLLDLFSRIEGRCFLGHTHWPGFTGEDFRFHQAVNGNLEMRLPEGRCLVNAGSVGQPRDGDPRACFLVVEGNRLTWERVPYDVAETQRRIMEAGLNPYLAERLRKGR